MRSKDIIDDDGNMIDPPPADHPVRAIVWLLEYGRTRGFRIGPTVQVGDTIVQVQDMRLRDRSEPQQSAPEPTIWQANGHDDTRE
jgi:hypothetical protein